MLCYRRHGHNEGDEPGYTQPVMYRKIKEHPSVARCTGERLVRERMLTDDEIEADAQADADALDEAYDAVAEDTPSTTSCRS